MKSQEEYRTEGNGFMIRQISHWRRCLTFFVKQLYCKIYNGLKKAGVFLLGDYIARRDEEEELLRSVFLKKQKQSLIPDNHLVKIIKDSSQHSYFGNFCHCYDSNPFVCVMGRDNLLSQGAI